MTVAGDRLGPTIFERSRPGRGGGKVPHRQRMPWPESLPASCALPARGCPRCRSRS